MPVVRFRFSKTGPVRFISHRDTMRAFARAFRRSGLALSMTSGYNPHVRFSLPLPLSVGEEGLNEVGEVRIEGSVEAGRFVDRMNRVLPAGIDIVSAAVLRRPTKARPVDAVYEVRIPRESVARIRTALKEALAGDVLVAERLRRGRMRKKNIRPFVREIGFTGDGAVMRIALTPDGSTDPAELVAACTDVGTARKLRVVRTAVNL